MQIICLDLESYYDKDFTLSKLTTEEYVRDPRFECFGASIKWGPNHEARWYDAPELARICKDEDWSDVAILCHHTQFDGLVLSHYLDVRPGLWLDTLSMARMLLGNHLSVSLDSVRRHFGMAAKQQVYDERKGMHWHEIPEEMKERIRDGCNDEVESIWALFGRLMQEFPIGELEVVDMTIRMFVEPVLRADVKLLQDLWISEETRKRTMREAIAVSEDQLQSAAQFCALLEEAGVEIGYKKNNKGEWIQALAKTDEFMQELLESEDEYVVALAEARIGAKSTLLQSRAERLGTMAQRGALCVYLGYCAAHTTRWGGGDGTNFQNFKRRSDLRKAVLAPDGYLLLVIDLSQTECRMLNWLAGQDDVIERFRNGHDPYIGIASEFYGRPITKDDEAERGTGKQAELSCGFGCAWRKFKRTAALGIYGPSVRLSDDDSKRAVDIYRGTHRRVTSYWGEAGNMLKYVHGNLATDWGPMKIRDKRVYLPNGTRINYDALEWYNGERDPESNRIVNDGFRLKTRKGYSKMYGAKFVENVVQALSRVVLSDGMKRLNSAGFRPVITSHDDLGVLVKNDHTAPEAIRWCTNEMKKTPEWSPGLPLDCDYVVGERYAK